MNIPLRIFHADPKACPRHPKDAHVGGGCGGLDITTATAHFE